MQWHTPKFMWTGAAAGTNERVRGGLAGGEHLLLRFKLAGSKNRARLSALLRGAQP